MSAMNKEYLKNVINWFAFTVLFGMFPIIFLYVSWLFTGDKPDISLMAKEIFFFTIVLCADTLRTYNNLKNEVSEVGRTALYGISIIVLILSSVLYGGLLIYGNENHIISYISISLCVISFIIGLFMQRCVVNSYKNIEEQLQNVPRKRIGYF